MVTTITQRTVVSQPMLTVKEVASILNVHSSTVRRWGKDGLLKSYEIGYHHNLRFKEEDIQSFLAKCQEENAHKVALNSDMDEGKCGIRVGNKEAQ